MYQCYFCKNISKPKDLQFKVVLQTREVIYSFENNRGYPVERKGTEIVEERSACAECYPKITGHALPTPTSILEKKELLRKQSYAKKQKIYSRQKNRRSN